MSSPLQRALRLLGRAAADAVTNTSRDTPGGTVGGQGRRRPRSGTAPHHPTGGRAVTVSDVTVWDVASRGLPAFVYAPDPDGAADPGEVVWTWVPYEEDATRGKDRPVLVLARVGGRLVVAQMTSKDHDRDAAQEARWGRHWYDVGTGAWDSRGRPSEVRLDRLLLVEDSAVRREGATLSRAVYEGAVTALREHWD